MKRRHILRALPLAFVLGLVISGMLTTRVAYADVNAFTVTDFTADYYLTNADPQGEMHVIERIKVDFTDYNHGVLRAIPTYYKQLPLDLHIDRVSSDSGAPAQYTTSTDSHGNEVLKIGDPDRTVTGVQEYTIDYTTRNVIGFYGDHDELYWDANGDQWQQLFQAVTAVVHLPSGLKLSRPAVCYSGPFGSTDSSGCTVTESTDTVTVKAANLEAGWTLTFVVGFGKGYFRPTSWLDYMGDYSPYAAALIAPIVLLGGGGFLWWLKRGRDAKGAGVIIPQYDAPDNMTPIEVGTLADFRVDNRDVTATIIDLAIRGYVKIIEEDKQMVLRPNKKLYALQLVNKERGGVNQWEQALLDGLFTNSTNGRVELYEVTASFRAAFAVLFKSVRKSVEKSLTDRGYFVSDPTKFVSFSLVSIIVVAWILTPNLGFVSPPYGVLLGIGATIGAVLFVIFYHFMPARTAKGVAAREHALGLKMYMEVAEKDRLKMLQSPGAPYASKTNAPETTVELFEKLLPYAIALKVEKQWAKKFENIYRTPPDWYGGNVGAFSAGYLVGSLGGDFGSAISTGFGASGVSSGTGFGGGGFSGGGGGGGGGGGW